MTPLALASRYMQILFDGGDIDEFAQIFSEDFTFRGPFFSFNSAEDYLKSLKSDPPKGFGYKLVQSFEKASSACLLYQFTKPGVSTTMAQYFEVRDEKICGILLIFDSATFSRGRHGPG